MTQLLISIGSNQDQPLHQVERAAVQLEAYFSALKLSRLYETQPLGPIRQASFINAVALCLTELPAAKVLQILQSIESHAGRDRSREVPKGPRNLDLDLILYGVEISEAPGLELPHPRFRQRRFVLEPAAEIAPDLLDPLSHKSIRQLLQECADPSWVRALDQVLAD